LYCVIFWNYIYITFFRRRLIPDGRSIQENKYRVTSTKRTNSVKNEEQKVKNEQFLITTHNA
jgi:hypothetical protein